METRPPTAIRILIAVGFAISCFALALFLWVAFGGPVPLASEGYRVQVPFDEATQLAQESDVRISGVSVGKVKGIELNDDGQAEATIELDSAYAPIPSDTQATLRQKTLLGETYVELSPGSEEAEPLAEDGTLAAAQVAESVQIDEVFRTFDEPTREAFQAWMQTQAAALRGRGEDLSTAIGSLEPFASQATEALRILDSDEQAVSGLISNGGEVFQALSERQGQLSGLIKASKTVFETTANRNAELEEIFQIFPTFLKESRATLAAPRGVRDRHRSARDAASPRRTGAESDADVTGRSRARPRVVLPRVRPDHRRQPRRLARASEVARRRPAPAPRSDRSLLRRAQRLARGD